MPKITVIDAKTTGFNPTTDHIFQIGTYTWDPDDLSTGPERAEWTFQNSLKLSDEWVLWSAKNLIMTPENALRHLNAMLACETLTPRSELPGILKRCYKNSVLYGAGIFNHEIPFFNKILKFEGYIVDIGLMVKAVRSGVPIANIDYETWSNLYYDNPYITYGVDTVCVPCMGLRDKLSQFGEGTPRFWDHITARSAGDEAMLEAMIYSGVTGERHFAA